MRGRYSIIGLKPDLIWRCRGDQAEINRARPLRRRRLRALPPSRRWQPARADRREPDRAAGRAAADGRRPVRLSRLRHGPADRAAAGHQPDPLGLPDGDLAAPDRGRDLRQRRGPGHRGDAGLADAGVDAARRLCPGLRAAGRRRRRFRPHRCPIAASAAADPPSCRSRRSNIDPRRSTTRWSSRRRSTSAPATSSRSCRPSASPCRSRLPPFALYRALRRPNPSPFLFFLDFGGFRVVGLEPGDPGAAARRQGHHPPDRRHPPARRRRRTRTRRWPQDLLADPKERAEHLMLLDLGRNDVGRVAKIGTVQGHRADHQVERYSHVMHIVSNVEGEHRPTARRARRADRRLPRRHRLRRAQGAGDGDHRRAGARAPRRLCRRRRLFRRQRHHGHLHRAAHRAW